MASTEALGVLISSKSRPLTSVRLNVIDMRGNYCAPFLRAMSAIRFLNEPVPFDPSRSVICTKRATTARLWSSYRDR
jgi:hypothetical protein